jgi:hypothetical protein
MGLHTKPAAVVDPQRGDQCGGDRKTYERASPHFVDQRESGIDLHRSDETANHSPPGHSCQLLRVGSGCGRINDALRKKNVISANEIAEASQGLVTYLFS